MIAYNTPNSPWTDDLVLQLKVLWIAGEYSCTGIAAELGHGITRNAVVGKARRLGLAAKKINPTYRKPQRKPTHAAIKHHAARVKPASRVKAKAEPKPTDDEIERDVAITSLRQLDAEPVPDDFLGIPLLDLEWSHCRYPRTVDGRTLFCGQPKMEESSYCARCHRRCHTGSFGRASNYVPAKRAA